MMMMGTLKEYFKLNLSNRKYILLISFFWLFGYFTAFWRRVGINENNVTIANSVILLLLALMCKKTWSKKICFFDICIYVFFIFTYYFNAILYPSTAELVERYALNIVLGVIPFYFMGLIFKYDGNEKWLALLSRIAIVINIVYVSLISANTEDSEEQMNRAYVLLPSVLYLLLFFFERHNYIDLIFFLLGFFMECSMGSRGPFVCVLFFAATYLFLFKKYKHVIIVRSVIVIGTFMLYLFSTYFAYIMIGLLSIFGRSTRIFDLMLDDALVNYENSNGRDMIQGFLLQRLDVNNGVGYGLLADRLHGAYAHNIFIEMWYDFGYIYGSIIIGVYLLLVALLLIKSNNTNTRVWALLFFSTGFVKLQFSGAFIFEPYFFFLIGFCISGIREYKKGKMVKTPTMKQF